MDNVNFMGANIAQGAFAIRKILDEFGKASKLIKSLQEKVENIALRYKDRINCVEDIGKLEDEDLRTLENSNIVDSLIQHQ